MLDVTSTVKNLYNENKRQYIRIDFPNNNATIRLTEADIVQGSFKWDRYCTTGDMLEIGSAIASEVEFDLINNGSFKTTGGVTVPISDISFEGKELTIDIGVMNGSSISWLPIGMFTIMSMPHKFSTIHISALDRMTWLDMYSSVNGDNPFPSQTTLSGIISAIHDVTNIPYTMSSSLPNYNMVVDMDKLYEEETQVTFRMLVQWVAELTGTCACINTSGTLVFRWLNDVTSSVTITPHQRYSSKIYEPVMFGGLLVQKNEEYIEFGTNSYYRFGIIDNPLLQGDDWADTYTSNLSAIWDKLQPTSTPYRPFEASVVPMPYLEPLDVVRYTDNDSNHTTFNTLITHITFTLNGGTSISAVGISETEAQCVGPGYKTKSRDNSKYDALKDRITALENSMIAERENMTNLMRLAMGLQKIEVTDENGGIKYYFTTATFQEAEEPTLENLGQYIKDNDVVYAFTSEGWMWCFGKDWDAEAQAPTTWSYGITKDGTAILGQVNTAGVNIADVNTAYHTVITPETYSVYNGTTFVFGFNGRLESQINRLLVKSNINDPTLENNAYIRLGNAMLIPNADGLDIVYCGE